ncbi:META domain-containing protein [Kribbella sp. NPDC056951]|uniref:META domain-containing protein n=1 Tax=Kribbella sp. NPDC056951 TaxID=3345978 RepID=UPI003633DF7A
MSNTDLEDELRGTLDRAAASVPPAAGLSDRAATGVRQARRRTWMVSGAAAVAVAAVAVTGFALTGGNTSEQPPVAAGGAPQSTAPTTTAVQPFSAKTIAGRWHAVQITGTKSLKMPRPDDPVLLFKADGTWSGSDGCNALQGTFTIGQRGEFAAKIGPQHLIGCENVPHTGVLQSAKRIAVTGDTLTFAAADGHELAKYARAG